MLGYLPRHLEQNSLVESAEQTNDPPYLDEIYIHSAAWPSGERWERREATKERDSVTDKVELERKDTGIKKNCFEREVKSQGVLYRNKKDEGRKFTKIFQRELSMVSEGVKGKEVRVEQCCPLGLKGLKSYFVPVCHHPWCIP